MRPFVRALTCIALTCVILPTSGRAAPMDDADVVLLGEVHDNPAHHARQAQIVAELAPAVLVFEMLTPEQAARVTPELAMDASALEQVLDWAGSGWPDFALYASIFAAAPEARVLGAAVPRAQARAAMQTGIAATFGAQADAYGLTEALPAEEQAAREADQLAAHCDALPEEMLPLMVDIQRLRDAVIARAALRGLEADGSPVVVITGNGHARLDRGAPVYLTRLRPGLRIHALGQSEAGDIAGRFDTVEDAAPVDRPDPCLAFRAKQSGQ